MNNTGQGDTDYPKKNGEQSKVLKYKPADPKSQRIWLEVAVRFLANPCIAVVAVAFVLAICSMFALMKFGLSFAASAIITLVACTATSTCIVNLLFFKPVSMYFALNKRPSHVHHLQKRPLASLLLFAGKGPHEALFALNRDLKENALPAALARISSGEHLIIVTHLASPGIITRHLHATVWEPLGQQLGKALPAQACACAAALVRFLRTGRWTKPGLAFRRWYLIRWVKP